MAKDLAGTVSGRVAFGFYKIFSSVFLQALQEAVRQRFTLANREFQRFGFELLQGHAHRFEPRFTPEYDTPKGSFEKKRGLTASFTGSAFEQLSAIVPRITAHPGLSNSVHTRNPRCP